LSLRPFVDRPFLALVLAILLHICTNGFAADTPAASSAPTGRFQDASLDAYRTHLQNLAVIVQACAKARDLKTCDPTLVGPDDRVPLASNSTAPRRLVRYGWLRVLLSRAEEPDTPQPQATPSTRSGEKPFIVKPESTSDLLRDAQDRLAADLAEANGAAAEVPNHSLERSAMEQVLAGRDFRNLERPTVQDSLLEKVGNWLNRLFESATRLRAKSAWIGRLLVWGFVVGVCVALIWALLQMERRWRVRLVPEDHTPAPGAASARNWQLWLEDAQRAAANGDWREAIHFIYWAAISRLESRRLWPADRARTPREYLALVAPDDQRQAGLATLTGSFERTWYGGRPAQERDYRLAEQVASALIAGTGGSGPSGGGAQ
jgi:hypothetical protein